MPSAMLISNAYGLLALAIIVFIILNLNTFGTTLLTSQESIFRSGLIVFLVGFVTEWLGAKGRIFFTPVWLIGIFILAYWSYHEWGFLGLAMPLILSVFLLLWWGKLCDKHDRKMFAMAKRSLDEWREQTNPLVSIFFWDYVRRSIFFPITAHTKEVCIHNREVLERVWQKFSHSHSVHNTEPWREFDDFLCNVIKSDKSQLFDRKLKKKLIEAIDYQYLQDRNKQSID